VRVSAAVPGTRGAIHRPRALLPTVRREAARRTQELSLPQGIRGLGGSRGEEAMSNGREDYFSKKNREFFEKLFDTHDRIEHFEQVGDREYLLHRQRGDTVHVHITGKYTFGVMDLFEV